MSTHDSELSKEVKELAERASRLYIQRQAARGDHLGATRFTALSANEVSLLDSAGLEVSEAILRGHIDPKKDAITQNSEILSSSMTVQETSALLGLSTSRIRQMIRERSLAAILEERRYLVPRFQFADKGLVPGFGTIYRATPPDVPLVVFFRWLTQPSPDLALRGGRKDRNLSPKDWLLMGFDPVPVRRMAALL